jgi:hypothetical protein
LGAVVRLPHFALYLLNENEANDLKEIVKLYEASKLPEFPFPPSPEGEDLQFLLERSIGTRLSVIPQKDLEGLRCSVWQKREAAGEVITAHLVNYCSPIPTGAEFVGGRFKLGGPPEQYAPRILNDVVVRLRLPQRKIASVTAFDPDSAGSTAIEYWQQGDWTEFKLPPIRVYRIVRIALTQAAAGPSQASN